MGLGTVRSVSGKGGQPLRLVQLHGGPEMARLHVQVLRWLLSLIKAEGWYLGLIQELGWPLS